MASTLFFKFDRQEGDAYYFLLGEFGAGVQYPSFGESPVALQSPLSDVLSMVPSHLNPGTYVGGYEVPVFLRLVAARSVPWTPEDLLEDILIDEFAFLAYYFGEEYELLYLPMDTGYPSPYAAALSSAVQVPEGTGDLYSVDGTAFPLYGDTASYTGLFLGAAVAYAGAFVRAGWQWLWSGAADDPDTDIINRLWGSPSFLPQYTGHYVAQGSIYGDVWGVWDPAYGYDPFRGLSSPKPLIDILSGLSSAAPFPIYQFPNTITDILSLSTPGPSVQARIPVASTPFYAFKSELDTPEVPIVSPFLPLILPLVLPLILPNVVFSQAFLLGKGEGTAQGRARCYVVAPREYRVVVNTSDPVVVGGGYIEVSF